MDALGNPARIAAGSGDFTGRHGMDGGQRGQQALGLS
jgi:hypothetical protein